jgi:aryl-alcohol dehydrogenase-like predicted oxidoreductase
MDYRRLGDSGLKVSEIGLGCNNFGMRIDQAGANAVIDAAIEHGVTFFDTADQYGSGKSEEMIGNALKGRRHQVVVATKFASPMGEGANNRGASRRHIMEAVEASLTRLQTDYIDLYQLHRPDPDTPIAETLGALDDIVAQGKVRYIGNSNFSGWQIADADWTAREGHMNRFVSAQNHYSLLERGAAHEVTPACQRFGLGLLPFFPLASGLLTGKYKRGETPPQDSRLAVMGARAAAALNDENFSRLEALSAWAEARGHDLLNLAFAWLLGQPVVSSVIAGATKPEQVAANAGAAAWKLTPEDVAEVTKLAG